MNIVLRKIRNVTKKLIKKLCFCMESSIPLIVTVAVNNSQFETWPEEESNELCK